MKPVKPEKLLALIDEKLGEQSKAEKITEEKVAEWSRAGYGNWNPKDTNKREQMATRTVAALFS